MYIHTALDINLTLVPGQHRIVVRSRWSLSKAPGTFVASVLIIPDSIQMDYFNSWVSNPEENNGPLMSVVTWCLVLVAGTFLAARIWIRQHQGKLWLDDCTLVVSWVSDITSLGKEQLTDKV